MSNAIHAVAEYIRSNREGARGRNHSGIELLNRHVDYGVDYEELTLSAVQAAEGVFLKSRRTNGKPFKLTATSSSIGLAVLSRLGIKNSTYVDLFAVGDLFIEALLQLGYIEIEREYEGYRAPYVIYLTGKWEDLGEIPPCYERSILTGTSFKKFPTIVGLRNPVTKRPYIKRMTSERDFDQCLDQPFVKALNKLQQVPWRLNVKLVKALRDNVNQFLNMDDRSDKGRSKRIEMKFILAKARGIGTDTFYQAVECDYRGRVYYTEAFLNYQGSDLSKGLFEFSEGKAMDARGYFWLCVHTACSYNQSYTLEELDNLTWLTEDYKAHLEQEGLDTISVDKMSLNDRAKWTIVNLKSLIQDASHLIFREEAEKPVTLLACALDLQGYQKHGGNYKSHLPIPVDGSNNGWQHLAAMSKDSQAGELVSLVPQGIQKDFYVQVAKRLITRMPDWFAARSMPMKAIRKGIAKRGSMTRAYSAGQRKIAENMYYDCKAEGYHRKYKITKEDCDTLSKNLILSINDTCVGPLKTMKFLQKITDYALESGNTCMQWTTPSGFPVMYEVWKQKNITLRCTIRGLGQVGHSIKVPIKTAAGNHVPCRRSFASGCSPNFVHSMDASHMAKVIESFSGAFGAVHDSFSTHSCDVDKLLEHTKWQFASMYNTDNFFNTIENMLLDGREGYNVKQPELGTLKIEEVLSSEYFFS
jgi:DNA-directed RNA polymerase|tara:strand:- start:9606 stop:11702 length:2097 start_codon:yes stop_codon:yes gene_type:complete